MIWKQKHLTDLVHNILQIFNLFNNMGSIVDYIECPNCKSEDTMNEFWYKTAEESIFCSKCGYSKKAFIKNRDKKLTELTDEDWDIGEVRNPYGAFRMLGTDTSWIAGTLETEEDLLMMQNPYIQIAHFGLDDALLPNAHY
jgi:Zn ribbon nucleic-acid-binding protein